jgi:SAM-dependent methyltransferase
MHRSSYDKMLAFRDAYLGHWVGTPLTILDVGSAAVSDDGASYRSLFSSPGWRYIGLDVQPGPNVDMVVDDPYRWSDLPDASIDVVISGQAFEHIEWPWLTIREIARVMRRNGIAAITAPSAGPVHRFPRDCWRFYPDGMPALAAYAGLRVVEHHWDDGFAYPENALWGEVFVVLQRPVEPGDDSASAIGEVADARAIARRAATMLGSANAWAVKANLLRHALSEIWVILRTPLHRLKRL